MVSICGPTNRHCGELEVDFLEKVLERVKSDIDESSSCREKKPRNEIVRVGGRKVSVRVAEDLVDER